MTERTSRPCGFEAESDRLLVHIALMAHSRSAEKRSMPLPCHFDGLGNGPPGVRAQYHPYHYGAFGTDPQGHNIEACKR
jgi:hypothetical protein